jgi:hypothetical protein
MTAGSLHHLARVLRGLLRFVPVLAVSVVFVVPAAAQHCGAPVDFLTLPLASGGDPVEASLEAAYPGLDLDLAEGRVLMSDGQALPASPARAVDGAARLEGATLGDQFATPYPLAFDLNGRRRPWFDPGRVRDEAFMRALWFQSEAAARASLFRVEYRGAGVTADFPVTTRHCAHVQAAAALAEVAALGPEMDPFFRDPAGSFNWRPIAGTERQVAPLRRHALRVPT